MMLMTIGGVNSLSTLNSSSDVLFTATAELSQKAKEGSLTAEDMVPNK